MKYLTIDGMLSGTGIRDSVNGGYINPKDLGISCHLVEKISKWLREYKKAHYMQYNNKEHTDELDDEGILICCLIRKEIPNSKVEYYSDARMEVTLHSFM